jgi:hypothetical protein
MFLTGNVAVEKYIKENDFLNLKPWRQKGCLICDDNIENEENEDIESFVCSRCTRVLIMSDNKSMINAFKKACMFEKNNLARFLANFIMGGIDDDDIPKRDMDGERVGGEIKPSYHESRDMHKAVVLDTGRSKVCREKRK